MGGAAIDVHDTRLAAATVERTNASDIVLVDSVGGPRWNGPVQSGRIGHLCEPAPSILLPCSRRCIQSQV
ncbi:hypothetical protein [Paraburkholderia silvatlantica]|uniref:hypothetical protein n=1 Tax=Paraburkholderia silvatlantica TaxID=321895 RepID=UPI0037515F57